MKKLIIIISILFSVAYGQTCDTVTNLTFSLVTTSTARVTWTHATNKISYNWALYCLSGCGGTAQQTGTTAGNTLNLSGLNSSFAYQFCITTYCGATSSTPKCSNFTTLSPQIQYTPMTAAGYQFKYVKVDTGFNIPFQDTTLKRGTTRPGALVCNTADSNVYSYNGNYWELLQGVNSAANKVDSVIINSAGDSLFYWINGTSYGQVFGGASSRWSILGNSGTVAGTNFLGTTDSVRLDLRTNNTIRQSITGSGNVGIGTVNPSATLHVYTDNTSYDKLGDDAQELVANDSILISSAKLKFNVNNVLSISGLPSGVGTKALRINPSTGIVTYADTTAGGGGANIYNSDGTLTGNRIVSGGVTNSITFTDNNFVNIDASDVTDIAAGNELHFSGDSIVIESNTEPFTGLIIRRLPQSASATDSVLVKNSLGRIYSRAQSAITGQNISNASLTANGDYVQDWKGYGLSFDSLGYVGFATNNGITFNSTISGNDFAFFDPNGTFYTNGTDGTAYDKAIESTNSGQLTIKSTNALQDNFLTRFTIGAVDDIVNAAFTNVNVGIGTSNPSTTLHIIGAIKNTDSVSFKGLLPMSASTDSVVVRDTNGKFGTTAKSAFGSTYSAGYGLSLASTTFSADSSVLMNKAGNTFSTTTGTGVSLISSTVTSGSLMKLTNTGTAAASNTKNVLAIVSSGANGTASQTVTGQTISVTNTGTTNTNVGLNVTASGATNNYAALFTGRVGIGTATPVYDMQVSSSGLVTSAITSTGNAARLRIDGSSYGNIVNASGQLYIDQGGTNDILFRYNGGGDTYMVLKGSTGNVGIGTTTPAASSLLDVTSTTKGFLPPRMTATQGSSISSPAEGLMIYVTNTNGTFTAKGWWGYDGAAWQKLNN